MSGVPPSDPRPSSRAPAEPPRTLTRRAVRRGGTSVAGSLDSALMTTPADPVSPGPFAAVDEAADRFLEGRHIPGVAYAVVLQAELLHVRGLGTHPGRGGCPARR